MSTNQKICTYNFSVQIFKNLTLSMNYKEFELQKSSVFDISTFSGKIGLGLIAICLFSVTATIFLVFSLGGLTDSNNREILADSHIVVRLLLVSFIVIIITGTILLISNLVKNYHQQLKDLESRLKNLSEGNIPDRLPETNDERQEIVKSFNALASNLIKVKSFAEEVGKGSFDNDFEVFGNEGQLGKSLGQMRKSLREIAEEDKIRNWSSNGIAHFSQLLRLNNVNVENLCVVIISELVKYLKATQGAIYILNDHQEHVLEMKACYAYDRRKFLEKNIKPGEGLVGQIFLEKETTLITDIPEGYMTITSGLGDSQPRSVLLVPLKLNEKVLGVIELASLKTFQTQDIQLTEKIGESIASTISNLKVSEDTNHLLRESLERGEQLKLQEEQMRQSLEELQATQEQVQRQTQEMTEMQESLMLEKSMFHVLMNYSPDRLTYKDVDCKVLRVNLAKAQRFNLTPEQMIGTSDADFFPPEHAAKAVKEEKELIRVGEPKLNILEKVVFEDGNVMFINTSRIPFKNEKGEFVGTCCISKDITQTKLNEAVIRNNQQMIESLIANMPVLKYRINAKNQLTDINIFNINDLKAEIFENETLKSDFVNKIKSAAEGKEKGEMFSFDSGLKSEKVTFDLKHYIVPDEIYDNCLSGFAILIK